MAVVVSEEAQQQSGTETVWLALLYKILMLQKQCWDVT